MAGKELFMKSWSLQTVVLVAAALCLSCVTAPAQSKSKSKSGSSGSGGSGSSQGNSEDGSTGMGFSIETEMFTYQAVEANSRVIACDIAQYLYGGQLASAGAGAHVPCVIQNQTQNSPGIILVSSGSSLLPEFQLWRADMAMMNSLEQRADQVCVAKSQPAAHNQPGPGNTNSSGIVDRGLLSGLIANASPASAAATTALAMLASNQSVTSVVGTVQDPALLNEVARQLRALGVQVLIPEMYGPNALGPADYAHSPYMANLQNLFNAYDKCDTAKANHDENAHPAADMTAVTTAIDKFLGSAFATSGTEIPGTTPPPAASSSNTQNQNPATPPPTSHFAAVLAADELAQEMGYTENGTSPNSGTWQHLMWLQALESGGSVSKQGNIFGTKVYFGGGAVDTYSVFRLDGELVCSGNAYNFQPPVKLNDLVKTFQKGLSDDPTKSPLLQSTCSPLPPPAQR